MMLPDKLAAGWASAVHRLGGDFDLSRRQLSALSILLLSPVFLVACLVGVSEFSPDSWAYFELSKSIFSDRFYTFNTLRSYFSETYSASFPFGYPAILAVTHLLFGADPRLAIGVNLAAATASWFLIMAIGRRLGTSSLHALGASVTLLLFPGYLDEINSGRAIPVAILLVLLGVHVSLARAGFVAGLLIGLAALIRFDFLPYALLVLAAGSLFWPREPKLIIGRSLGLLAALAPWMVYSCLHFGKVWISDNSWVALSATPAFVLDFPARPAIHAFENPQLWLRRVVGNGNDVLWTFASNLWAVPVVAGLGLILLVRFRRLDRIRRRALAIVGVAGALGLAPYLLTGYFDARYFSFPYLVTALALAGAIGGKDGRASDNGVVLSCLFIALIVSGSHNLAVVSKALASKPREARIGALINRLDACQRRNEKVTYIFNGQGMELVFRYGAVTGQRVAAIPSNFDRMTETGKKRFFDSLAPYRLIERLPDDIACRPV